MQLADKSITTERLLFLAGNKTNQMLNYRNIITVLLCNLLLSCSGGNSGDECSIPEQNRFVHELLLDQYFWYQEVEPTLNYKDFDSPEQTLDFLKVDIDRFSYIADAEEFYNLFTQGQVIKYGFSFLVQSDNTVQIRYIFDDSAAGRAGLQRGDSILSINNQPVAQIISTIGWEAIFGPDEEGYPVDMLVRKSTGDIVDIHMEKSVVNINTVLHRSIIENGSDKVAYLVFNSFLSTSIAELTEVFAEFKAAAVNKMVLDLRYNGGGSVTVAQYLASWMLNTSATTDLFALLKHNDKHQDLNQQYFFKSLQNELALEQITVITTGATASASEMVINGLKPFVDIKTVGATTVGKPVGMNPTEFCDKMILPITFSGYNQDGEGEFFDGIAANCGAEDNLDFAFGDTQDPMLKEALFVSLNNVCSSSAIAQKTAINKTAKPSYSLQDIIGVY